MPCRCRHAVASDGIVLPRFLRRPARLLGRLTDGDFEAPRYSASILTIGLLAARRHLRRLSRRPVPDGRPGRHVAARLRHRRGQGLAATTRRRRSTSSNGWGSTAGPRRSASTPRPRASDRRPALGRGGGGPQDLSRHAADPASRSASRSRSGSMAASFRSSSESGRVIAPYGGGRHAMLPLVIGLGAPAGGAGLHRQDQGPSRAGIARQGLHPRRRAALGRAARERHDGQASRERRGPGARPAGGARSRRRPAVARHRRRSTCGLPTASSCSSRLKPPTRREAAVNERMKAVKTKSKPGKKI